MNTLNFHDNKNLPKAKKVITRERVRGSQKFILSINSRTGITKTKMKNLRTMVYNVIRTLGLGLSVSLTFQQLKDKKDGSNKTKTK